MAKKLERLREFFQGKNEEVKRGHEIIFFQLGTLSSKVNISTYYLSTSKALFGAEDEKFILFPSQFTLHLLCTHHHHVLHIYYYIMESTISNNTLLMLLEWIMIDECSLLFQICFCNVAKMAVWLISCCCLDKTQDLWSTHILDISTVYYEKVGPL